MESAAGRQWRLGFESGLALASAKGWGVGVLTGLNVGMLVGSGAGDIVGRLTTDWTDAESGVGATIGSGVDVIGWLCVSSGDPLVDAIRKLGVSTEFPSLN